MTFKNNRQNKAFSLIEMITVVTIAAIMMVVALPSIPGMVRSSKMSNAKNLVKTALAQAQSYAVRNGVNAGIRFQKAANGKTFLVLIENEKSYDYLIVESDGSFNKIKKNTTNRYVAIPTAKPKALPDGVSAISAEFLTFGTTDTIINEYLKNYPDGQFENLQTFTIVFSPSGQMVTKSVCVEPRRSEFAPGGYLAYTYNNAGELVPLTDDLYGDTTIDQFTVDSIFGSTLFVAPEYYKSVTGNSVRNSYIQEKRAILSYDKYPLYWVGNVPFTINDDVLPNNDSLPWCNYENSTTSLFIYMDNELADAEENGLGRYSGFFMESSYKVGITTDGTNQWAVTGRSKRDGCEYLMINKYTGELIETEE